MINGQRVIAVVPARGGSKGVHRKNLRVVAGHPLIHWTIAAALASNLIDRTFVSSEDSEILETAKSLGAEVIHRPDVLASDTAAGVLPLIHAAQVVGESNDILVYLQPTSPIRTTENIDEALHLYSDTRADVCVSVKNVTEVPHWMHVRKEDSSIEPFLGANTVHRRQDINDLVILNGAIYITSVRFLSNSRSLTQGILSGYLMDEESSIDIDSELDLQMAELVLESRRDS